MKKKKSEKTFFLHLSKMRWYKNRQKLSKNKVHDGYWSSLFHLLNKCIIYWENKRNKREETRNIWSLTVAYSVCSLILMDLFSTMYLSSTQFFKENGKTTCKHACMKQREYTFCLKSPCEDVEPANSLKTQNGAGLWGGVCRCRYLRVKVQPFTP